MATIIERMTMDIKDPLRKAYMKVQLGKAQAYCDTAAIGTASTDVLNELFREIIQESWSD